MHGGLEHSGHYRFLVDSLVDKGFALAGLDLRGHGKSKGDVPEAVELRN